jgi:hypothetical protein
VLARFEQVAEQAGLPREFVERPLLDDLATVEDDDAFGRLQGRPPVRRPKGW